MYQVDDTPETIHLYVVREEAKKPFVLLPIVAALFCIGAIIGVTYYSALHPYYEHRTLTVPAIALPAQTFPVSMPIIPTGVKTYPAATAHGILMITNGSIIGQSIPAGFTIQNVTTDAPVYVPPGNANGYGYATVSAHVLISGKDGNISTLAVNQVIGSSVFIRNLSAFSGGRDSYSVKFATAQDKQAALTKARAALTLMSTGLHYPCSERISGALKVTWQCQMLTYQIAAFYHVTGVRLIGKNLLISVWFIPRPVRYWVK